MKKVFLVALMLIGITTFAQDKKERGPRPEREKLTADQKVQKQVEHLKTDLNLNEKQTAEVKALVTKQVAKREAKKAEMDAQKEKNRAEMKAKMMEEQTATKAEMKKILTAEQFTKWEAGRADKKEKVIERIKDRKKKR